MGPGLLVLLVAAGIWHGSASPTIEPNVPTVTVNNGDLVNFLCYGDSSVEWITKEKNKVVHTMGTNSTLTIASATYKDTGTYQCAYTNSSDRGRASVHLFVRDPTNVWYVSTYRVQVKEGSDAQLPCLITNPAYGSNVTLLMDNHSPILPGTEFSFSAQDGVTIYRVQQAQKGYYRCQVLINGEAKKSARIRLLVSEAVEASVSVTMDTKDHVRIQGEPFWVTCQVKAPSHKYDIAWKHPAEKAAITKTTDYVKKDYIINVTLTIAAVTIGDSGRYTCMANNSGGSRSLSTMLKVIERGYVHLSPVQNTTQNIALGGSLQLQVQIEAYPPLHDWGWKHHNPSEDFENSQLENQMATGNNRYTNTLVLSRLQRVESGFYTFYAANREDTASMTFSLFLKSPPRMNIVPTNNSKTLRCLADGYPAPHVEWYQCYKHAERYNPNCTLILNDTRPQVLEKMLFKTVQVESILTVPKMSANLTFCCVAVNEEGNTSETFHPYITREVWMAPNKLFNPTLYSCVGISILLLLLLLFLLYKYKQKPKYQVRWKIIEACEGNNYIFIDPTQLPYNRKWEFPRNNLQFGKTLGAGAFGKVVEATAFGLGKEDSVLKVAVKMLKATADTDEQEALMSELKIMSHLGHHENIVNLLGACTCGGPILVITEYCRYGDLLNFLRKKAECLIIQDLSSDSSPDNTANYKNIYLEKKYVRSDSGFASQTLETYVEMRPVSSSSSSSNSTPTRGKTPQEEEKEDARPLDLHDLLQFSNQVAQGMAFLASKNCIHRDVAARNVLVSDGRVAKICDFGLARDIMNDSNYVVKGNARLPVKWMAPESIFDCIYTVQSDVWSYGILLWEIFSLGKSPYPGMAVNSKFYNMVKLGYQMARPDFAPLEMYSIMQACWNLQATQRPTFDQICHLIQKQMEVNKEQDYINLPAEEDSGCEPSSCCEESCDQGESSQPLLNSNNYQFC
ncbi:mast/stem cell growth factor receptor Kit isoform B [Alligator mississippiensis]|uniref:receptor protein-tyrosine kinase n=1 Tax=Alligator mississippiensis TaxID=8496 RepID=A0A151M7H6_ALLMI|nr:mast/stem cell growth factor receptor Kit isoform B [Alligator mississippiensis]